jgi:hypothetical protein
MKTSGPGSQWGKEARKRFLAPSSTLTIRQLLREYPASENRIVSALSGRNCSGSAKSSARAIRDIDRARSFAIPSAEIMGARLACLETGGVLGAEIVAQAQDLSLEDAQQLLVGQWRPDVPFAVPFRLIGLKPFIRDCDAIYWRKRYAEDHTVTTGRIAESLDVEVDRVGKMLSGVRNKYLKGAVALRKVKPQRTLPLEVALFIKLQYDPPRVTKTVLCKAYNASAKTVSQILAGTYYKELPYVVEPVEPGRARQFTDKQVLAARFDYYRGIRTPAEIAKSLGQNSSRTIYAMLLGTTYADVGGIPQEILKQAGPVRGGRRRVRLSTVIRETRRKRKPIPARGARLPDHDERVDLRANVGE